MSSALVIVFSKIPDIHGICLIGDMSKIQYFPQFFNYFAIRKSEQILCQQIKKEGLVGTKMASIA